MLPSLYEVPDCGWEMTESGLLGTFTVLLDSNSYCRAVSTVTAYKMPSPLDIERNSDSRG